jgi:hypothetical protein
MKLIKGGLLKPYEICEFSDWCRGTCEGKDNKRNTIHSCGLRRAALIAKDFEVKYGCTNDEVNN